MTLDKLKTAVLSLPVLWGLCGLLAVVAILLSINLITLVVSEPETPRISFPRGGGDGVAVTPRLYPSQGAVASSEELSEASVKAELLGVISGGDSPRVNMKVKGGEEAVFRLKDEITPGVIIEAIEADRVVVRERGVLRQITFAPFVSGRSKSILEISTEAEPVDDTKSSVASTDDFGDLQLSPVLLKDGQSGIRIEGVGNGLSDLGFIDGDVIISVEGLMVVDLNNQPDDLERISQQNEIALSLQREGQEISLSVDGNSLRALLGR